MTLKEQFRAAFKDAITPRIPDSLLIGERVWPNIKGRFTSPCGYFTISCSLWADGLPADASLFHWPLEGESERLCNVSTGLDADTAVRTAVDRTRRLTAESIIHTEAKLARLKVLAKNLENV